MKIRYKLTFFHKFIGFGLLFVAVLLFCQPKAYQKEFEYGPENKRFSYLQRGDYVLDIYYGEAPVDNDIVVYTEELINTDNSPGIELAREHVGKTAGTRRVSISLKEDAYNVQLRTTQDTLSSSGEEINYISRVSIQSVQLQDKDNYLLGMFCMLGALITFWLGLYIPMEKYKEQAMLVAMGLGASMLLFSDFIMNGDDLGFHVARLEAIYQGLRAGEFPVYLGSTQMGGFGTLSATMYPSLFLYPVALLRFWGVSLMLCYKILVVCIHVGSAFTSYYGAKAMCKSSEIGFWASVFYTFSIYRLTNIYFRGALGETMAMVFLPLVIWGIYEVLWGNYKKWYLLAMGMGGVLQSHVLSAEMCVFFLIIEVIVWLICGQKKELIQRVIAGVKATGLTILANAFFLIPFLFFCGEELQCFNMPNQLSETVVYFSQMFSLFAQAEGVDMEVGSTIGEMPHTIGTVLLFGVVLLCVESLRQQERSEELQIGQRCLVYGGLSLLLSSWLFPWEKIQSIDLIYDIVTSLQFAWRFLSPASALLSISAAVGIVRFAKSNKDRKWVLGVAAALVIVSTSYFFGMKGLEPLQYSDKVAFNGFGYTDAMYMYSDGKSFKPFNLAFQREDAYIITLNDTQVSYSDYMRNGMKLSVTVTAENGAEDYLLFPFYYYPGYEILVNGKAVEVYSMDYRVACQLPEGTSEIQVSYVGLPIFAVANWVSVFTILAIIVYTIMNIVRKCKRQIA